MRRKQLVQTGVLVLLLAVLCFTWFQRQAVADWLKLYNYDAPNNIAALADETAMTSTARQLFYVNKPEILSGKAFSSRCPLGGEKTVVLGCYIGNDQGIYLYDVTDERLNGVEQVTAAHEMLHAAYRRLSERDRSTVDRQLQEYYTNELTDERIKRIINGYKITEPNDVINEMHSIFATEISNLPPALEEYYAKYFTNRTKVTSYLQRYQTEFTSRQNLIEQYDIRLGELKPQIDTSQTGLASQRNSLDSRSSEMQSARSRGDIATYNSMVAPYNTAVSTYNALVETTRAKIALYNSLVAQRNAVAIEEQQLIKAISNVPETK